MTSPWRMVWIACLGLAAPVHAQYSSDFRYDPNTSHPTEVIRDLQMLSPEKRVDTAMYLFKGVKDTGPKIATQILLAERPEYVVPRIVDAIAYDVLFEDQDRRRYAFIVLVAKQDWPHPMTYDLMSDGLLDFRVEEVCRIGFEQAPPGRRQQAAVSLADRLQRWYQQHGPATGVALEILGSYGNDGAPALEMIRRIFLEPSTSWPENRAKAGLAFAQVGGLQRAIELYTHMDSLQYLGALSGLAWLGEQSPSQYKRDPARARQAQAITLEALPWPSRSVVRAALATVPLVYGDSLYVVEGSVKVLHPGLKAGLIAGAEKQTDPLLRDVLITSLRQYEAAAANQ